MLGRYRWTVNSSERRDGRGPLLAVALVALLTAGLTGTADHQRKASSPHAGEEADIVITVVYDNNPGEQGLVADWGFGCIVQGLPKTILFDTGARGDVLLKNMGKVGIKPGEIDVVVLSHIHWDHTGGLGDFLRQNNNVTVFMPAAFPERFKDHIRQAGADLVESEKAEQVCPGASTTPVLGDAIAEQGLLLETAEGIAVITGCAHPGIVSMARAAQETSGSLVYAVLGGFHMADASPAQISITIEVLKEMGVRRAGPCHCSGDRTRRMMKEAFGEDYMELGVGAQITFPKSEKGESGNQGSDAGACS